MKKLILFIIISVFSFGESELIRKGHFDSVNAISKYPFGQTAISVGDDENIFIWDLVNYEVIDSIDLFEGLLQSVAISPGGRYFGVTTDFGDAFIFNYETRENIISLRQLHTKQISDVVFTNNNLFISGSFDGTLKIYDIDKRSFTKSISMPTNITALDLSDDGKLLAAGGTNGKIYLFSTKDFKIISSIKQHDKWITDLSFSPDNKSLAATSWDTFLDIFLVTSWDSLTLNRSVKVPTYKKITSVDWSKDDKLIALSSFDSNIYIYDADSLEYKFSLDSHEQEVTDSIFIKGSEKLVSGSFDTKVSIWDLKEKKLLKSFSGY